MQEELQARLKVVLARIQQSDRRLAEELNDLRAGGVEAGGPVPEVAGLGGATPAEMGGGVPETIVLRTGRPVLAVVRDEARLDFADAESEVWRERLTAAREPLGRAIRAVGRIEVAHHPRLAWIGTGWLVAHDIVVTNRHVANELGRPSGSGFVFKMGTGRTIRASIDFLEEVDRLESRELRLKRILHIEGDRGPDLALLQVETVKGEMQEPIRLFGRAVVRERQVAVIGYPAKDSRIPDQQLMQSIFGEVFDKKRLAPGQITGSQATTLFHDCSTLGGNSGSVVLDLESGEALGLHFAGRFLEANFAVPAPLVAERLHNLGRRAKARPVAVVPRSAVSPKRSSAGGSRDTEEEDLLIDTEARAEDYADRTGYDPGFLGDDLEVPLPELSEELAADAVAYEQDGAAEHVLRYQHFSVVMSRSRRLCFYSAVNIDGKNPRRFKRPGWRFDPRIPRELQILEECYGNPPRFARGHMTRREDPIWGSEGEASLGNVDSMHATNVVPQLQVFNAGIWLGLESYALDNAREDDMRISVFTGPFLRADDPVRDGVRIPRSFWKVLAFVHDETGELTATGYTLSQESLLQEEEFVFGEHVTKLHETTQVPIARIEQETGLSFGDLAACDPLGEAAEEALPAPLTDFRQIRLTAR